MTKCSENPKMKITSAKLTSYEYNLIKMKTTPNLTSLHSQVTMSTELVKGNTDQTGLNTGWYKKNIDNLKQKSKVKMTLKWIDTYGDSALA